MFLNPALDVRPEKDSEAGNFQVGPEILPGTNPETITLDSNKAVTAVFNEVDVDYTLVISARSALNWLDLREKRIDY